MDNIKQKFKAVIFDMDGTILQTEHIWVQVVKSLFSHHGITSFNPEQEEFLRTLTGMGLHDASAKIKDFLKLEKSVEDIFALKLALASQHFEERLEFIAGFEAFHKKLNENGIPSALATNAHPDNLASITKTMQLENYFGKNIYCIKDVDFKAKPDPALFLHAAAQLGRSPHECIVFEDTIHGFNAAKAAGIACVAVKNPNNQHLLHMVSGAIESYDDAEELLKKI